MFRQPMENVGGGWKQRVAMLKPSALLGMLVCDDGRGWVGLMATAVMLKRYVTCSVVVTQKPPFIFQPGTVQGFLQSFGENR